MLDPAIWGNFQKVDASNWQERVLLLTYLSQGSLEPCVRLLSATKTGQSFELFETKGGRNNRNINISCNYTSENIHVFCESLYGQK